MKGYSVKVASSSKELTARERVAVKDTDKCMPLDEVTKDGPLVISVDFYVVLDIHNEKSEDKDYKNYVVFDKTGNRYITGSESFFTSMTEIIEEMDDSGEEYEIEVYRMPSKNYKGKEFLTCAIV